MTTARSLPYKAASVQDKAKHWAKMEANRIPGEGFKFAAFDFIGVHHSFVDPTPDEPYTLSAPMCLVDKLGGSRPEWEWDARERFSTKRDAIKRAREIATYWSNHDLPLFVVDCH